MSGQNPSLEEANGSQRNPKCSGVIKGDPVLTSVLHDLAYLFEENNAF